MVKVSIGLSCNSRKKGYPKIRTPVSISAAKSIMKTDYYMEDKRNSKCYGLHSRNTQDATCHSKLRHTCVFSYVCVLTV